MTNLTFRFLGLVLAVLVLSIIPLPASTAIFRPSWVLMFVLYVQFFLPRYFRVTWVLLLGLSLDVLQVSVLGEHAFALLLTSCLAASKTRRFHFFSVIQQMILIALFCCGYELIIVLIDKSLGFNNGILYGAVTVLATLTFWPWFKLVADKTVLPEVNHGTYGSLKPG